MTTDVVQNDARFVRGPGVCGNEQEALNWAGTRVLSMDDGSRFGIRSTSAALLGVIEEVYGDRVIGDDGPALYSLSVGVPGKRRAAPLHFVFHGGQVLCGTRDLGRLVRMVVSHASQLLEPKLAEPSVLATTLIRADGRAVLAPIEVAASVRPFDRLVTSAGIAVADTGWSVLRADADGRPRVVIPRPGVGPDPDALDLDSIRALGPSAVEPIVEAGERELVAWAAAVAPPHVGPLSPAHGAAATARLLRRPYPESPQASLRSLVEVARQVPLQGISWTDSDDLVGQIAALATASR